MFCVVYVFVVLLDVVDCVIGWSVVIFGTSDDDVIVVMVVHAFTVVLVVWVGEVVDVIGTIVILVCVVLLGGGLLGVILV